MNTSNQPKVNVIANWMLLVYENTPFIKTCARLVRKKSYIHLRTPRSKDQIIFLNYFTPFLHDLFTIPSYPLDRKGVCKRLVHSVDTYPTHKLMEHWVLDFELFDSPDESRLALWSPPCWAGSTVLLHWPYHWLTEGRRTLPSCMILPHWRYPIGRRTRRWQSLRRKATRCCMIAATIWERVRGWPCRRSKPIMWV